MGVPLGSELEHGNCAGDDGGDPVAAQPPAGGGGGEDGLATYLSLIGQYLDVFHVENATFLAERCVAAHPGSADARYLLALCHHRAGEPRRALLALEPPAGGGPGPLPAAARYLAAQAALQLKDYARAEDVLLKEARARYQTYAAGGAPPLDMDDWILQTTPCPVPNGAAGLALLATVCRRGDRRERAVRYYRMSLRLDPFLWTSFKALCELGVPPREFGAADAFGMAGAPGVPGPTGDRGAAPDAGLTPLPLSAVKTPLQPIETPLAAAAAASVPGPRGRFETPGLTPIPVNGSTLLPPETPPPLHPSHAFPAVGGTGGVAPTPAVDSAAVLRRARAVAARQYYPPSPETPVRRVTRSMRYLRGLGAAPPAEPGGPDGAALASSSSATTGGGEPLRQPRFSGAGSAQRHLFLESVSENQSMQLPPAPPPPSQAVLAGTDGEKPAAASGAAAAAVTGILQLLATLGAAYQRLCQYECREALAVLQTLPLRQRTTGWVLHQQGRAQLEMGDFPGAQRSLELLIAKDPGRVQGLELLSTVYWQLKKEVELAHLSQHVVDLNRLSPEAWCVVGNCFSLQKDHESALLFFKRSLQLDPDFTYTQTLSGYEYMANEDFEKAIACFRQALRIDERHYNAWYGLGAIHHRQEKFDLAEYYFEKAVAINPSSSVLRCNLGIAQHANGKPYQALDTLAGAFQLDPRNPQARFQRATIYSSLQRYREALAELERVRDAAPREATIHFAMGKVLKRLGRPEEAMKCFLTAMDLDPKDNQMIKSAMDKLDEPDIDEETIAGF